MSKRIASILAGLASIAVILGLLVTLNIIHPFPSPNPTPTPSTGSGSTGSGITRYVGKWQNVDPNTRDWVRIEISAAGNTLVAHFYGACSPTPCDAGSASATFAGDPVHMHADESFATRDFTLSLAGNTLHVTTFTHFTDNSGRADYTIQDDFQQ